MGFDSPWLLLGLVGVLVPIAIHLHLRRNAPVVVMDAVMRLVLAGGRTRLRLRLVHALLLTSRVAIVTLLALLFARPFLRKPAEAGVAAEHPVAAAIVLDNSMSMRLSAGGETAWARARSQVQKVLAGLPPESDVFVVLAGRPVEVHPTSGSGWDPDFAAAFVARQKPGSAGTDLSGAVRTAARLVRASPRLDRRVIVASDFFDHGQADFPTPEELAGVSTVALDVGPAGARHPDAAKPGARNRAIVETTVNPAQDAGPSHVRVRAVVLNGSDEPFDDVVTVRIGRNGVARKVDCEPHARCPVEFLIAVPDGALTGEVRLPPDDLPDDDVRGFPLSARDRNAVLLVDGEPRRRPDLDEAFFLSRALGLRVGDDPGFAVTVVRPDEMSPLHLSAVGSVGLLNVPQLLPEQVVALRAFVTAGGGLFVSMGDLVTPNGWSTLAGEFLPAPIRDVVDLGEPAAGRAPPAVAWVADDNPAMTGLLAGAGSLSTAGIRHFAVLDDGWPAGTAVLASMDNGLPLVVERRIGRGVVVTLLTSVDRDWSDLPLRPAYAPLVRQVFGWLKDAGGTEARATVHVGEARRIELPPGFDHALVTPPQGPALKLDATDDFTATDVPGAYRVDLYQPGRPDPARTGAFIVETSPDESDLQRVAGVPPALRRDDPATPWATVSRWRKVETWPALLVGVLLLLLAEAYLRGKA